MLTRRNCGRGSILQHDYTYT